MFKKNWPVLLFLIVLSIFITNYTPGTWLTGWDNLHPEFNFWFNIKRSLFAVWQEYQGLGLLGGMGHAADLPRQLILLIVSLFLPSSLIRYFFHFFMLFIGSIGTYVLVKNIVLEHFTSWKREWGGLLSSIFYLFNLATLQMFQVPFEAYSSHYGFLPWLVLTNLNYLKNGSKLNILFLVFVNILASSQAYIGTFFLSYTAILTVIFTAILLLTRKLHLKKILIAYLFLIITNAYWLFPNLYFINQKVDVNINAKINYMSTNDIFLRNKKFGDMQNAALLKGFWFDNKEMDNQGIVRFQMEFWRKYFDNKIVLTLGYSLFSICVIGILYTLLKRFYTGLIFLPAFLLAFSLLANDAPFFSSIASLFYKMPIFNQVFRFPFTKFSILIAFFLSIYFSLGSLWIASMVKKRFISKVTLFIIAFLLVIYLFPIFKGNFFYFKNRGVIPDEYFKVFDFFNKQSKAERIANFPQNTFWGWAFYRWNYSGSGFIWYGIEQPIMDRAFDVWSREDENYYHEVSQAIYSADLKMFESLLEKYQISWILVDNNIVSYSGSKQLYLSQLESILNQSNKLTLAATFGNIKIFKINLSTKPNNFVFLTIDLPEVAPQYTWNNYDKAFTEYGNYISDSSTIQGVHSTTSEVSLVNQIYYPFRSIFTGRKQEDLEFEVKEYNGEFIFKTQVPKELAGYKLYIPILVADDVLEFDISDPSITFPRYPRIYLDGEIIPFDPSAREGNIIDLGYVREGKFEVVVPKIKGLYSFDTNQNNDLFDRVPKSCDFFNNGVFTHEEIYENGNNLLRLESIGSGNCLDFDLPELSQRNSYLASIENRNIEGKSLLFSVINKNSQRADIETYLPKKQKTENKEQITKSYFVIPPMEQYAIGYTLHFDNISIGRVKTVNDLGRITVNPIPYRFLTGMKIIKNNLNLQPTTYNLQPISVSHPNPSFYQVQLDSSTIGGVHSATPEVSLSQTNNLTLVLSQSFDKGWQAYEITNDWLLDSWYMKLLIPLFAKKIDNHVLVNNWENGWEIGDQLSAVSSQQDKNKPTTDNRQPTTTIAIVYLPQYLEYLGFGLLGVSILYLLLIKQKKTHKPSLEN